MPDSPLGDRDRDWAGRPRSSRPRDALGRPLPRGATGVPRPPEDRPLSPAETVAEADRLLTAGRPFAAHEVLETAWKAAPAAERELWRALAQVSVGLTHLQRGNHRGAVALLRRGAHGLAPCRTASTWQACGRWPARSPTSWRTRAGMAAGRADRCRSRWCGCAPRRDCVGRPIAGQSQPRVPTGVVAVAPVRASAATSAPVSA